MKTYTIQQIKNKIKLAGCTSIEEINGLLDMLEILNSYEEEYESNKPLAEDSWDVSVSWNE